ncbi:MAG: DUF3833 domain-containing protein [Geminicoccaceae bacterium]
MAALVRLPLFLLVLILGGCSGMKLEDFANTQPVFRPETYFAGKTRAWGFFQDRFGNIRREFTVDIVGTFDNDVLTLDEQFVYADGERDTRVWTIRKLDDSRYEGTADDVVGTAQGRIAGKAMNWQYQFDLPVGSTMLRATFDDWMFLQDDEVMLNRTTVSKFGIKLGEVVIFFRRLPDEQTGSVVGSEAFAYLSQQAAE